MAFRRHTFVAIFILLFTSSTLVSQNQTPRSLYEEAANSFREGKGEEAEKTLRAALRKYPDDPRLLGLLGVVLDSQKRYEEASKEYRRALALAPHSPSLLNNLANHYMAQGKTEEARAAYLQVVAANPGHANANLHLAQFSVEAKRGADALKYLKHLSPEEQSMPATAMLRAQALMLEGQSGAAVQLLHNVEQQAGGDPRVSFSVGMTYVKWQHFAEAEAAFSRALDDDPANYDILYNLGLAALKARDFDRALSVLQVALNQRPNDPDCLLNLANAHTAKGRDDKAIILLLEASNAAPNRTDILFALAQTSEGMGFYADAASAIDKYLQIKPEDDIARRERGFCHVRGGKLDLGIDDLRWYAQKHPKDPRGLYELAIAETVRERDKAVEHLNQALRLDPNMTAARYARGVLYYQTGLFAESIEDLKLLLKVEPGNAQAMDALGQNYLRLNQYEEAEKVLARAAEVAPKDAKILTHYSRALLRTGRQEEAEKVIVAFKNLGPEESRRRPYGGLFEFLQLPREEQFAKYSLNLRRSINTRPQDPGLRVRLGKALLHEGKIEEAIESFRAARERTSDASMLATCGKVLLDWQQYAAAREFLEPALASDPSSADVRLDLATANFHAEGPEAALRVVDQMPADQRKGDYYLLRAQVLDSMGKPEEAAQALTLGFRSAPTRPDLYFQAALFLIKHKQYQQAVDLLQQGVRTLPNAPELQLCQAIAYEMLQRPDLSEKLLAQIEARWPEWSLPYLIQGISLETRMRSSQARPLLETAISLGAQDAMAYYYLASAILHDRPDDFEAARQAIQKAVDLNPQDAYVQSLAGKIAYQRKEYPAALERLNAAIKLWPEMAEAHQTLSGVYRAMGEKEKSIAELKEVLRIKQQNPTADQTPPFLASDLLFTVRRPSSPTM